MSAQSEALRLAEWLEGDGGGLTTLGDCAAELRRLSAENEAYGVHLSERMKDLAKVEAQRIALLEALKLARSIIGHPDDAHSQMIDAAIKQAEGENT